MSAEQKKPNQETKECSGGFYAEFPIPTYEDWKNAAIASLKGAPFEKKVFTRTHEDIELKPIYLREDAKDLPHLGTLPGFPPFVRGCEVGGYLTKPWDICQEITSSLPREWNEVARFNLDRGQTALNMVLDRASRKGLDPTVAAVGEVGRDGVSLSLSEDLNVAFSGIDLSKWPVFVETGAVAAPLAALWAAMLQKKGLEPDILNGCVGADPLGELAREGHLDISLEAAFDAMGFLASWARDKAPRLRTIIASGQPYHDAGANAAQELAYALATAVTYVRALQARGLDIEDASSCLMFSFSIGTHFFMEIAKFRAARLLWSNIVEAFGGSDEARKMKVHARTSAWTKTMYDPYVNMLRNTTEAFAGVMGGVDSLHVAHFDETIRPNDEFSRRVSRNLQVLLQEECRFTRPIDPAGGSWYVEVLTDQLAQKAWSLFQEVEAQGGMVEAIRKGLPQAASSSVAHKKASGFAVRKDLILGTNMYPNLFENPLPVPDIDLQKIREERMAFVQGLETAQSQAVDLHGWAGPEWMNRAVAAAEAGASLGSLAKEAGLGVGQEFEVTPLKIHRASEPFEALRRNMEKIKSQTGAPIRVFLANMGPIPQHKPRADFSTGFFQVGGFEVIGNHGFDDSESAAKAALESGAPIVVICSTDAAYPEIVPNLTRRIKAANPDLTVILAGKPAPDLEKTYKDSGLDNHIHVRANCLETLLNLQKRYGGLHVS